MSRRNNRNLTVRDNGVELLLGFPKTGNVVKNDFRFFVLLRAFRDSDLDRVNDRKRGIPVIDDFHSIIHSRGH